jgi:hypothetical protein
MDLSNVFIDVIIAGYVLLYSVMIPILANFTSMIVLLQREVARNQGFAAW